MTIVHLPKPKLCGRLNDGDERAFREVFNHFHKKIFQVAYNLLTDYPSVLDIVLDERKLESEQSPL